MPKDPFSISMSVSQRRCSPVDDGSKDTSDVNPRMAQGHYSIGLVEVHDGQQQLGYNNVRPGQLTLRN